MHSEMENVLRHIVLCGCAFVCTQKQQIIGRILALVADKPKVSSGLPFSLSKLPNIFEPHLPHL